MIDGKWLTIDDHQILMINDLWLMIIDDHWLMIISNHWLIINKIIDWWSKLEHNQWFMVNDQWFIIDDDRWLKKKSMIVEWYWSSLMMIIIIDWWLRISMIDDHWSLIDKNHLLIIINQWSSFLNKIYWSSTIDHQ